MNFTGCTFLGYRSPSLQLAGRNRLSASRFYCGDSSKVRGEGIGCESFGGEFEQAKKRALKVRPTSARAIYQYGDRRNDRAVRTNDLDGFLDTAAAGDDILCNEETLACPHLEAAAQDESSLLFFNENMTSIKHAGNLMTDDNSSEGRGDNRFTIDFCEPICQRPAYGFSNSRMLQHESALEKLAAVETGP